MAEVTNVHTTRCARNQMKAVIATIDGVTYTFEKIFAGHAITTQIDAAFRALPEFAHLDNLEA